MTAATSILLLLPLLLVGPSIFNDSGSGDHAHRQVSSCAVFCSAWSLVYRPHYISQRLVHPPFSPICSYPRIRHWAVSSSSEVDPEKTLPKEDHQENKPSTAALLQQLDRTFNYEGRLPSKQSGGDSGDSASDKKVGSSSASAGSATPFRCGFVSIIGAANMGKSTLLNALLQEDLCIATRRPQTTRHAILGVLSTDHSQVCLLDTPGVLDAPPAYKLQEHMMEAVKGAVNSADVLLVVTDLFSTPLPDYDALFQKVQSSRKPVIVAINKVDLVGRASSSSSSSSVHTASKAKAPKNLLGDEIDDDEEEGNEKTLTVPDAVAKWRTLLPEALAIIPLSASQAKATAGNPQPSSELLSSSPEPAQQEQNPGVHLLRQLLVGEGDIPAAIRALGRPIPGMFRPGVQFLTDDDAKTLLPEGPPLYDEDLLTDRTERFFVSELVRESLFESLKKELPYSCEVQVTDFKEPRDGRTVTQIEATIFVERDSQKIIVVGKGGQQIKQVGILARNKIERFLGDGMRVNLQLVVKVKKDWRKKDDQLKQFGYQTKK